MFLFCIQHYASVFFFFIFYALWYSPHAILVIMWLRIICQVMWLLFLAVQDILRCTRSFLCFFFICLFYTYVCIILSSSFTPKHHFHVLVLHLYFSVLKLCSYVGKKLHFSQYKICIVFHMPVKNTLIWHLFPYALAKRIIWLELELRDHFGGTNIITSTFLAKSKTCHMCMCEGPGQMDIVLHLKRNSCQVISFHHSLSK